MGFWLSKVLAHCLYPLTLATVALAGACALLWLRRWPRLSRALVTFGALVLLLFAYPPLPTLLDRILEAGMEPLTDPHGATVLLGRAEDASPCRCWIVVLGTGFNPNAEYPPNMQVSPLFWSRLTEAVRLHRR